MKIKISSIQFCPRLGDIGHNLEKIRELVSEAARKKSSLVILPETCDTGYDLEGMAGFAKPFPNKSTGAIAEIARVNGITIVAGMAERRGDEIFNSAVVFDRLGNIAAKYDKVHLCEIPPLDEPAVFAAGSDIRVHRVEGIALGLGICFDIRFPELFRKLALAGAQIIALPTAFPRMRIDHLTVCARSRAIENQFFVATANCCGRPGSIEFGGSSMIIGPDGDVRARANETDEAVITAEIDLSDVERIRKEKPIFTARRPEIYK